MPATSLSTSTTISLSAPPESSSCTDVDGPRYVASKSLESITSEPSSSTMLDISTIPGPGGGPSTSRRSSVLSLQRFRRPAPSLASSTSSSSIPMDLTSSRSRSKEGMSDAALVDREWEDIDWERVRTLPTVYLTPPEEENTGPVALYPLLPPLPPPSHPGAGAGAGANQWGGMAKGFVQPPPVFSRTRASAARGGGGVIMPKTRDELAAEARSRRIRLAEADDKRLWYPPPVTTPTPPDGWLSTATDTRTLRIEEDRLPPVPSPLITPSDEQSLLVTIEPVAEPISPRPSLPKPKITCSPMMPSSSSSSSSLRRASPPTRQLPLPPTSTESEPSSPALGPETEVDVPPPAAQPFDEPSPQPPPPPALVNPPTTPTSKQRSRKRTFSLTSLLASRSHKSSSNEEDVPPVPVIRKHKSLKQLFTPTPTSSSSSSWATPVPVWSPTPTSTTRRTTEPRVSGFAHAHPPSRLGKRFSLSSLSSSFKRSAPGGDEADVPPVPLLPAIYRQDEVIARRNPESEIEMSPNGQSDNQAFTSGALEIGSQAPLAGPEPELQAPKEEVADPIPAATDLARSSHEERRDRSESGCSVSTLSSSASQTCRNLTHVSPRTQRNPSASLALRQYIHDGPSVGTVTEFTATLQHRRYESVEATVVLMERADSTSGSSSEGHQTVIITPVLPIGEVPSEMDMDEIRRQVPITRPPIKVVVDLDAEHEEDEDEQDEREYRDARRSSDSTHSAPDTSPRIKRQSTTATRTKGLRRFITLKRHSTGSSSTALTLRARPAPVEPAPTWQPTHGRHLKSLHFDGKGLGLDFEGHEWTEQ